MKKCVFCSEEILNNQFYESENFRVIYNIAPILPGHSLIVPKHHYISFLELNSELRHELIDLAQICVEEFKSLFNAEGFDLTIQDGECAGQTVMHLHLHMIPRKTLDLPRPGDWYPKMRENFPYHEGVENFSRELIEEESMVAIIKSLRKHFSEVNNGSGLI
ncbi:MAG: HIT family protein [Fusobacteria bacterium]|nr:HIT family protein [Fusobacteriota bacterium]